MLLTYTRGSGQTDGDVGKMLAEKISYCRLIIKRPGNAKRKGSREEIRVTGAPVD